MTRVTRHLAALALAGTVATSLFAGTSAWAGTYGANDGLVNIEQNNVAINTNVPVALASQICGISVDAIVAVDKGGQKTECKQASTALGKAFVVQN